MIRRSRARLSILMSTTTGLSIAKTCLLTPLRILKVVTRAAFLSSIRPPLIADLRGPGVVHTNERGEALPCRIF